MCEGNLVCLWSTLNLTIGARWGTVLVKLFELYWLLIYLLFGKIHLFKKSHEHRRNQVKDAVIVEIVIDIVSLLILVKFEDLNYYLLNIRKGIEYVF